jgi:DEAD/DEAH box helicase domain-containing protein
MDLYKVLAQMRQDPGLMRDVCAWEVLPAQPARTAPWPRGVEQRLVDAVRRRGIEQPYTHQAEGIGAALNGQHVVLATSTASGKTLAYNLPVLNALLSDREATALYVFPTKALAHDQINALKELGSALEAPIAVRPYDGDTPSSQRPTIRREARLLVTNPDMLHSGILPHHTRWSRLFGHLRYVVLDEIHTYRGVFGGHVANLLRRLRRVCRFYGSDPRFLCASATIANPLQLAEQLIEDTVTLVDDDGAPQGEKHFILYNPPLVDARLGIRRSAALAARDIASRFLEADIQTIVFARARLTTEVLLGYLRDSVSGLGGDPHTVQGYRGGYLPGERRTIERGLREGTIRGVVATNALELGVDIGQLESCIMAGYPGTVASTWQQAGRAGRRSGLSAAVLVASALPLDQYLVSHPEFLLGRPVEHALVDPDNLAVVAGHVACAAFELPFDAEEPFGRFAEAGALLDALADGERLHHHNGRYTWIGEDYPAAGMSLRSSTSDTVVIQNTRANPPQVIGQMDRPSVPTYLHTGAVYLHAGETYLVDALDWEQGLAEVQPADLDYYTRASVTTEVRTIEEYASRHSEDGGHKTISGYGEVLVTSRATGYRTIKRYTHETLGWAPIDLPEQQLRTIGYWLALPEKLTDQLQESGVLPPPIDYGPNWSEQRQKARERDAFACRYCGAPEREGHQHHVHHVTAFRSFGYVPGENDLFSLANQLDNLITLCPACHRRVERARGARGALAGLAYLLRNLAPVHLMCDPGDLGSAVEARAPETGLPTVTLFDRVPGGAGLSARLYELHAELLRAALDVVSSCSCTDGCPACVGPLGEAEAGTKQLTLSLLQAIADDPPEERPQVADS